MYRTSSPTRSLGQDRLLLNQLEEVRSKLKEEERKRRKLKELIMKDRQQADQKIHKLKHDLREARQKQQLQHEEIVKRRSASARQQDVIQKLQSHLGDEDGAAYQMKVRLAAIRRHIASVQERCPVFTLCSDRLVLILDILSEWMDSLFAARDNLNSFLDAQASSSPTEGEYATADERPRRKKHDVGKVLESMEILEGMIRNPKILEAVGQHRLWRTQARLLNLDGYLESMQSELTTLSLTIDSTFASRKSAATTPDKSTDKRRRKSTGDGKKGHRTRKGGSMDSRSISPQSLHSHSASHSMSSSFSMSSDVEKSSFEYKESESKAEQLSLSSGGRPTISRVQQRLDFEDEDDPEAQRQRGRERRKDTRSNSDSDIHRTHSPIHDVSHEEPHLNVPRRHRRRRSRSVPRPVSKRRRARPQIIHRTASDPAHDEAKAFEDDPCASVVTPQPIFIDEEPEDSPEPEFGNPNHYIHWHSPATSQVTDSENDLLEQFQAHDIQQALQAGTLAQIVPFLLPLSVHILKYSLNDVQRADYLGILEQRINYEPDFRQAVQFLVRAYPEDDLTGLYSFSRTLQTQYERKMSFFHGLLTSRKGETYQVPDDLELRDPICFGEARLCQVQVKKIFKSNTRPVLVDCFVRRHSVLTRSSTMIVKYNHDLRLDVAILNMFRYMNWLWGSSTSLNYHGHRVQSFVYQVVAFRPDFGCIQYVQPSTRLRQIRNLEGQLHDHDVRNLVATAAGGFIACYVMGVRDRHFDNVMVKNDGTLFHIDFDYVLGRTLKFDTSDFAITPDLHHMMKDHWDEFVELCCRSFTVLRENHELLIRFATSSFEYLFEADHIQKFVRNQLRLKESDQAALRWLRAALTNSPQNTRTRLKNVVHKMNAW